MAYMLHKMYNMAMKPASTAEKKARRIKAAPRAKAVPRTDHFEVGRAPRHISRGDVQPIAMAVARAHLAEHLSRVEYAGERVVIAKHGRPVAALVPIADLEALRALEDSIDLEAARKARREGGKSIPHEEVLARLAGNEAGSDR